MASRWMAPKLAKMARARKLRAVDQPTSLNRPGHTLEGSNRLAAQLSVMRQQYNGVVTIGDAGPEVRAMGKRKAQVNAPDVHGGPYTESAAKPAPRRGALTLRTWDTYALEESVLIPATRG